MCAVAERAEVTLSAEGVGITNVYPDYKSLPIAELSEEISFWVNNGGLPYISRHGGEARGLVRVVKEFGDTVTVFWVTGCRQVATVKVPKTWVTKVTDKNLLVQYNTFGSAYGIS